MRQIVISLAFTSLFGLLITTPLRAADAAAGKELFAKKCASCHGVAGGGKDAIAKMMKVEMRPLGSKEVQSKSDADLAKAIKDGTGKMKPVSELKEKDVQDIVAFLRTLDKK
jgi:mono/diheme cytochrome c family protein